jgi:hypothetical protein
MACFRSVVYRFIWILAFSSDKIYERLVEKLKAAQTIATRTRDLVEANAIDSEITAANARLKSETPPAVESGELVKRATFASAAERSRSEDVTKEIKASIHGEQIAIKGFAAPDLVPFNNKVLIIDGALKGPAYRLKIPESGINGSQFGSKLVGQ